MKKSELIENLSRKFSSLPPDVIHKAVNETFEKMLNVLKISGRIEIRGFGAFVAKFQDARKAHNPKTGEMLVTEPKYKVHFKPGKALRERVNASRTNFALKEDDEE